LAAHGAGVIRVCLIGPECTGKTTLTAQLASHFDVPWVPEFAREYAQGVSRPLLIDDVEPIANGEIALLDGAAGDGLVILDTDLISTVVYSRHYYGSCPSWIEAAAAARLADLYLLMDIDVPWSGDSVRDSASVRFVLLETFASVLAEFGARVVRISGGWEERFGLSVREIGAREGAKTRRG
jgi:NadR type nicotinamide-nucleotide adenylyltransferase